MTIKYINSGTNWINVQTVSKATMKKVSKSEKDLPYKFIIELYDNDMCEIINVYVKSYEDGVIFINNLYEFSRLDITTNPDVMVIVDTIGFLYDLDYGDTDDNDGVGTLL